MSNTCLRQTERMRVETPPRVPIDGQEAQDGVNAGHDKLNASTWSQGLTKRNYMCFTRVQMLDSRVGQTIAPLRAVRFLVKANPKRLALVDNAMYAVAMHGHTMWTTGLTARSVMKLPYQSTQVGHETSLSLFLSPDRRTDRQTDRQTDREKRKVKLLAPSSPDYF